MTGFPASLRRENVEVLVIDDSSPDNTFLAGLDYVDGRGEECGFKITVLRNPENQRYGGNQKLGYRYAIDHGFDFVALVHGDGQYAPESLPLLLAPLIAGEADAVFGSRMMSKGGARKGGMPLYKLVGNKVLTRFQNALLGTEMTEFHSGYRLYSTPRACNGCRSSTIRTTSISTRTSSSSLSAPGCGSRNCLSRPTTATRSAG